MQRISTEQDGIFKNGVPGLRRGTRVNAEWFNALQEEICKLLELNGISLDPSTNTQLYTLFRETLDRIFKGPVSVQDPNHPGTETTIDPDAVTIYGVKLQRSEIQDVVWLLINECVSMLKNLDVAGSLHVAGGADFDGWLKVLAYGIITKGLTSKEGILCEGDLAVLGNSSLNVLASNSATFKALYSAVDFVQDYGGTEDVEIDNAVFGSTRKRYRAVVLSGVSGHPQRAVNITASPSEGLKLHVINMALSNDGFVFVKWNQNNLCVLAPGVDRWFSVNSGSWVMDRYMIG